MGRLEEISRCLVRLLRHQHQDLPSMERNGMVPIDDILSTDDLFDYDVTREEIEQIVNGAGGNTKGRLELGVLKDNVDAIRATQGHSASAPVDEEELFTEALEVENLVHGTFKRNVDKILKAGIMKTTRRHIHFVEFTADEIIKDKIRKGADMIVVVDGKRAAENGIKFYRSTNGLVLTPGDNGLVPPEYILQVANLKTGEKVFRRRSRDSPLRPRRSRHYRSVSRSRSRSRRRRHSRLKLRTLASNPRRVARDRSPRVRLVPNSALVTKTKINPYLEQAANEAAMPTSKAVGRLLLAPTKRPVAMKAKPKAIPKTALRAPKPKAEAGVAQAMAYRRFSIVDAPVSTAAPRKPRVFSSIAPSTDPVPVPVAQPVPELRQHAPRGPNMDAANAPTARLLPKPAILSAANGQGVDVGYYATNADRTAADNSRTEKTAATIDGQTQSDSERAAKAAKDERDP